MLEYQEVLLNKIDELKYLPRSILLLGDIGSEFSEVCDYISSKFNLEQFDMSDCISREFIDSIYFNSTKTLYKINTGYLDDRAQNMILKLFEEPAQSSYIIIFGDKLNLLDTIINRSYVLEMERYPEEYLRSLVKNKNEEDLILSICHTPGQIEKANETDVYNLFNLCNNIIVNIGKANFSNTLSISNKINFSDNYKKYDLSLFISALGIVIRDSGNYLLYQELNDMNKNIWNMRDKKMFFENFLTRMWEVSRSWTSEN